MSVEDYIAAAAAEARPVLEKIRSMVRAAAPEASEKISYQMPAFAWDGILIYYAAFKNHIGIYPPVIGDQQLRQDLAPYLGPKGNLKFPLDQPIPYELIARVIDWRIREHRSKK